jgi:large subunit ribosomal protein L18
MDNSTLKAAVNRYKRAIRVRKKLHGTAEKPRFCVLKSNRHIAVQLIDDDRGMTLASAATHMKEFKQKKVVKSKEAARLIGQKIAEIAKSKSITAVVFDRGHYQYHGLVAELAGAAREAGLQF